MVGIAEDDVVQLLKKCGVEADSADLKVMMKKLKDDGKSVQELMKEGREQMATVSAAPAGGASAAPAAGGDAKADEKKEDKKEEEEEEDIDMGDMFGGDDDY